MHTAEVESYLDEALDLGRLELNMLTEGNVEQAEALANDRGRLLDMAWHGRGRISQDIFLNKMEQLQAVHSQVSAEARRLHKLLKDDLLRTRRQSQGYSGYRNSMPTAVSEAKFVQLKG
ncbi:hypothetical protein [Desulfonatronum lacustre]|uniref:hypothetical protein n=1 Tax=Desulfonatronum lacustre TaxID=66849 RepID=UPI0004AEA6EF|nr:hypothetical protein [Desulfonatronum lacustre]SMP67844.1 hypothetical protein SAMN06295888_11577 [Desulfonatronum zhilinae]